MSKEYIDRAAIRDLLYKEDAITMKGVAMINTFPAADVVERKKGTWDFQEKTMYCVRYDRWKCSSCGKGNEYRTYFCPNCGADMREEP